MTWPKVTVKKNIFNKGNRNKLCYVDEDRMPLFYCAELATSRRFENKETESKRRSSDAQFTHKRTRYESHFYIYEFNVSILLRRP